MKSMTLRLRRTLVASAVVLLGGLMSTSLFAQDQRAEDAESRADLGKIVLTGSRISRTDLEGAQPITVITNEDMAVRGYVTVFDALNDLTQNNGFKFEGPESTSGFSPDVQTLNLRAAGVGNTLVLVNGRRMTNYPAAYQSNTSVFNYGAIPAAAVERIEILATGASAIYGSDAIAGVVNIILRDDLNDTSLNLLYGEPTEASGSPGTSRVQLLTGKLFERGSITAALEYQKRDAVLGKQMKDFDSNLDYPYGTGVQDRVNLNFDWWEWYLISDNAYVDPGEGTCESLANGTERSFRNNRGYFCGYDGVGETNFRNAREHYSVFVNGQYDLNDNVELFADVLYYSSESESNEYSLFFAEDIYEPDNIVTGLPFGFGDQPAWYSGQREFTEFELDRSLDTEYEDDALTASVGARGYFRDTQQWEFSFTHSAYEFTSTTPWWKAEEVIDLFLGDYLGIGLVGDQRWAGNGTFGLAAGNNLFSPADADLINSAIGLQTYSNETESQLAQFTLSGDITDMKYGPLSYALVLEYETQDFAFIPDDLVQQDPVAPFTVGSGWYNLTGYNGEGDRERSALGFELRVPVLDTVTLNLAARVDDYDSVSSSIGTRTTPSASLEWRPNDSFLFRAGYTESFRAPDLNYVYTETGFFTTRTDIVQCSQVYELQNGSLAGFDPGDCDGTSIFAKRTPATELDSFSEPLKDETGWSKWIGFSIEPWENMSLQVDLSKIRLEDRVELESLQDLFDDEWDCLTGIITDAERCAYASNRIQRDVDPGTGVSFITEFNASPVNASLEEVTSLDVALNYNWDTRAGDFRLRADYTHMLDHTYQGNPGEEKLDLRDNPIDGGWDFRSIITSTLAWNYKDVSAAATLIRRGGTTVWRPTTSQNGFDALNSKDYWLGPYITWNLTAGYEFTDKMNARVRVQNLFDNAPPVDNSFLFQDYPWYNPYTYPGAGIGREMTAEFNISFY